MDIAISKCCFVRGNTATSHRNKATAFDMSSLEEAHFIPKVDGDKTNSRSEKGHCKGSQEDSDEQPSLEHIVGRQRKQTDILAKTSKTRICRSFYVESYLNPQDSCAYDIARQIEHTQHPCGTDRPQLLDGVKLTYTRQQSFPGDDDSIKGPYDPEINQIEFPKIHPQFWMPEPSLHPRL